MRIAPLFQRVTFEKQVLVQDEVGNESSEWQPLFSRWCSSKVLLENEGNAQVLVKNIHQLRFTLRFDPALVLLDSRKTRLHFEGKIYNIKAIDHLSYPRKMILVDATEEVRYDKD